MKLFLTCFLIGISIYFRSLGQLQTHSLLEDSTFTKTVARSIRYPISAREQHLVAKVYASFSVTEQGNINQIKILNFLDVDAAFGQEVTTVLTQLPMQDSRFKGAYILPITFQLEGATESKRPQDEDKEMIKKLTKGVLLREVYVVGYM